MKRNSTFSGRFALTGVAAAALCLAMPNAWALGLGKLQVQSALGETMRAEIDVTSLSPEESSNLKVRVATPDAYRAAGVDYNAVLPSTNVVLQRRADGRSVLRVTSDRAVQEPFVDVILEITWSTGRLVREYTLLFDPPNMARAPAPAPATTTAPVIAAAPVPPPAVAVEGTPTPRAERRPAPAPAPAPRAAAAEPAAPVRPAPAPSPAPAATPVPRVAGGDEYRVKRGDSLSKIASRTQRPGVSLDQMLVSLYRSNPQAFVDNNMNRLRSGVVLSVPSADEAKAVGAPEARQVIQAQSADFGAYRQRLAGAVPAARTEGSARQASGKVQTNVDDRKQAAAPTPDKLTLSKGAVSGAASAAEDRISKDREKKEAATRVAELSKNVAELKSLSNAAASSAAAKANVPTAPAAPPPAPAPAPAPAPVVVAAAPPPPPAPAPAPAPVPAPPPVAAPVTSTSPSSPASGGILVAAPTAIVTPAPVASAPRPMASAPRPAASAVRPPEPVAEEKGFFGTMMEDNPLALGLGGLAILLLAGFGIYRYTKRARADSGETSFLESRLQPDSFFGASGGQRIDTRDAGGASSSMSYSLSQLDAIGDVDPVAEADVYLAYGRDLQAEEILKEAMRSNPERMAIRTKLLEVYAKRRDTKGFELLATQLYSLTRGEGEDWAKAQELGAQIDPENPLFQPGGEPLIAHGASGEMIEPLGASTMPQSVLPTSSAFGNSVTAPGALDSGRMDLDLDLDLDDTESGVVTAPSPLEATQAFAAPVPPPPLPPARSFERAPERPDDSMSLDFSIPDDMPKLPSDPPTQPYQKPMEFDLSGISLDLDLPDLGGPTVAQAHAAAPPANDSGFADLELPSLGEEGGALADDGADDALERKLELADEFRQIGDTDGARDLLEEVVAKATGATKTRAQGMLDDLA